MQNLWVKMKQCLKNNLPPWTKLFIKRASAAITRSLLTKPKHSISRFVIRSGLDFDNYLKLAQKRGALTVPHFTTEDFKALRDAVSGSSTFTARRDIRSSIVIPLFN